MAQLANDVTGFYASKTPFWIYHGSTNCTRTVSLDRSRIVDTSKLNNILQVDTERMVVVCEPNVPMDMLVRETIKYGLIPPVIPEFPGITVGGAFSGTAGESSSFKYGYFDRTIISVEIILANGDIETASPTCLKKDLFNGAAGAFGTLGVLTLFEIQLIEAKEFVELTYIPVGESEDAIATLKACAECEKTPFDFVDGIQFSKEFGVVCLGRLTDISPTTPQKFSGAWDPWFYMHARSKATAGSKNSPLMDIIPLEDYLFRYDRGAFWMGKYYPLFPFSFMNNTLSRWFWDSFLHTRVLFQSMHISNRSQKFIIQDLGLPVDTAEEFLRYVDNDLDIYPLWLCPLKIGQDVNMQRIQSDLVINIGVWGPGSTDFGAFVTENRVLEKKLKELGGTKWLYAHTYYTQDEFWSIYNKEEYDAVRTKYHAQTLPNVYTKVKSTELEHPQQDLKATWHGLYGHLLGFKIQYLLSGKSVEGKS